MKRHAPVDLSPEELRRLGHEVVDLLADFAASLPSRPVTRHETPSEVRALLPPGPLAAEGRPASELLRETIPLLADHSLFNSHPRFWGFITAGSTPIGALGDLVAATMNPNVGAWGLAPIASEIEAQTVRWIADLVRFPSHCGGVLGSGGAMANYLGFLAARRAKASWDVRTKGLREGPALAIYASAETHTWIQKAADLFGLGTDAIRWIDTDARQRMRVDHLESAIAADLASGDRAPFVVVAAAGTVSTGAVDPLREIAALCRERDLWLHVDGAYGALAAVLDDAPEDLHALALADSLALDPHKWLYAPLEAGCTLVRDPRLLVDAFSFHPDYYHFAPAGEGEPDARPGTNYYELGMQNSRGFRALKVWLALRQAGRDGVRQMIADDCALSRLMHEAIAAHPELEARSQSLSISTFRYLPPDPAARAPARLDALNRALLDRLQTGGEAYVSNAVIEGAFHLRACIVNFRTQREDVLALPELVARLGREVDRELAR